MSAELQHIGFIADGNRRWAKEQGLPTLAGHKKGSEVFEMLVEEFAKTNIKYISFFVFSTENWNRSEEEVNYLMDLVVKQVNSFTKKAQQNNIRIAIAGRSERVKPEVWEKVVYAEESTRNNTGLTVCLCFNYGGKWEIADAATKAIAAGEKVLTPETFTKYLYHPEIPNLDFVVRTSGEERLSGFDLWRAAYAELLFIEKYFPALEKSDVKYILDTYNQRQRRFGK